MYTQNKVNLLDCISEITNRPICMEGENYLYLDTKGSIEASIINEAIKLKATKDIDIARTMMDGAIQNMLNTKAKEYRYDDIKSARASAGVPLDGTETIEEVSIYNEALALAKWDRAVWAKSSKIEQEVLSGIRPIPTVNEVLAEMPNFEEGE